MPQRTYCTKPRCTLIVDSVSRVMVPGWVRPMTASGRMRVRLGKGWITYPTGQPVESWKLVETGTSLYVGLKRLTKLVGSSSAYGINHEVHQKNIKGSLGNHTPSADPRQPTLWSTIHYFLFFFVYWLSLRHVIWQVYSSFDRDTVEDGAWENTGEKVTLTK